MAAPSSSFIVDMSNNRENLQQIRLPGVRELFPDLIGFPPQVGHVQQHTEPVSRENPPAEPARWTDDPSRRFPCSLCGRRFARPSALDTHMNSHTGDRPYRCPYPGCARAFSARSNMQRHLRTTHAPLTSSG